MKKALITGSAGFIGQHMTKALLAQDWDVTGIDTTPGDTASSYKESTFTEFYGGMSKWIAGDATRYDLAIHCAAIGGHTWSDHWDIPAKNLELDAQFFQWAGKTQQKHILYFSSASVYPIELQTHFHQLRLSEYNVDFENITQPDGEYGWVKLTGERLARAIRELGHNITVCRIFNVYGYGQSLFPDLQYASQQTEPIVMPYHATQIRDWIHVDDVIYGALAAVENNMNIVNLATGRATSAAELAQLISTYIKYEPIFNIDPKYGTEVDYRVGDPAQLWHIYKPTISLEIGLKQEAQRLFV